MFAYAYFWWFWMILMLLWFLPLGYGWGYRGWGPPYPSYVQQRRRQTADRAGFTSFNHVAWGGIGDLIWILFLLELVFCVAFFWRRQ